MPTSTISDAMTLNFFSKNYATIKKPTVSKIYESDQIDRIVSDYLSNCNTHQFEIIANHDF